MKIQANQVKNSNTTGPSDADLAAAAGAVVAEASKPGKPPTLPELVGRFCDAVGEARRLYRTASTPDAFWEQGGRIDAPTALRIGQAASIEAARRTLGYAEKHLGAMAERGLPETLRHRCERALRPCDQSDTSWAETEKLLELWADAGGKPTPAAPATPGRRRAKRRLTRKPLTKPQTDALTVYMRCNQNVGAAAVELGISRAAAYDRINAALKKTGDKPLADRAGKSVRAHAMG